MPTRELLATGTLVEAFPSLVDVFFLYNMWRKFLFINAVMSYVLCSMFLLCFYYMSSLADKETSLFKVYELFIICLSYESLSLLKLMIFPYVFLE